MTETENAAPEIPPEYGTFSNRMMAAIIDLGVLYMIALPVVDLIMAHFFAPMDIAPLVEVMQSSDFQNNPPLYITKVLNALQQMHAVQRMVVGNLLQIGFLALYILPFWFHFAATPGKMLFRFEIRDAATGGPMTHKQAVVRFFGYIVSALPLSLGFLWVLINRRGRGFHDLIAGTVVIVRPKSIRA
jgi:uncharacterized RDD family membrane protein YckC